MADVTSHGNNMNHMKYQFVPVSHLFPVFPFGQIHLPLTGWQREPGSQLQRLLHFFPNVPCSQTAEKKSHERMKFTQILENI